MIYSFLMRTKKTLPIVPPTFVVLGATGDLSARKLWPAFYNLLRDQYLDGGTRIIAASFDIDEKTFPGLVRKAVEKHSRVPLEEKAFQNLLGRISVINGSFTDASFWDGIKDKIVEIDKERGKGRAIIYCAVATNFIPDVTAGLASRGLARGSNPQTRIVIEKPFGHDLASGVALNATLHKHFDEEQIYRGDHYLGKETVQNLLVLRFANVMFEPLWNSDHVEFVEITVAEDMGMGKRGPMYDQSGALRDVIQNHMMQLLSLIAMEIPTSFASENVRDEKIKVLQSVRLPNGPAEDSARGQYVDYHEESGVAKDSHTETYAALRLIIDNWRWGKTPFYLRTGKMLTSKTAKIVVHFRPVPHSPFVTSGSALPPMPAPNELIITLQPREGIRLQVVAKEPGTELKTKMVELEFAYQTSFVQASPEAYEHVIHSVATGDGTLFMHADEVEAAWKIVAPVLKYWEENDSQPLESYEAGSSGPECALRIPREDGFRWGVLPAPEAT